LSTIPAIAILRLAFFLNASIAKTNPTIPIRRIGIGATSGENNGENTLTIRTIPMESIRSRVELEQKVGHIEKKVNFADIEALIARREPLIGRAVSFTGAYYSSRLFPFNLSLPLLVSRG